MRRFSRAAISGIALLFTLSQSAHATNGYFTAGIGAQSQGQAGVGVSSADGVDAAALNPALGLKAGNSIGGGIGFFSPHRDETNSGGNGGPFDIRNGQFDSGEDLFYVPYAGVNYQVDERKAISLLLYANGGMDTHYGSNPFSAQGASPTGVELDQMFVQPNLALKLTDSLSVGAGPIFAIQRFAARGLQSFDNAFFSGAPGFVTNKAYDYSYGAGFKIGALYDATPWLSLGVAYQSRIWATKFNKYKGLFANQGSFDIPPAVTEGITLRPIPSVGISIENEHIFYGDVDTIANQGDATALLGSNGGKGFGWKDMNVYRLGVEWKTTDTLTLRTGVSHATNFTTAGNALFNILAPATIRNHASVGLGYKIAPHWDVDVAYTHAFSHSFTGYNQNDPSQTIKLRMDEDEGVVGITYHW